MNEISDEAWAALVAQAGEIGTRHGKNAASWWEQHVLGGRAYGDMKAKARWVLDKLEDCDSDDLNLPTDGMSGEFAAEYGMAELYAELGISEEDDTDDLELVSVYQDAFSGAVESAVAGFAHGILSQEESK